MAAVVRTAIAWPTDVWFVRLSTGQIVGHRAYAMQSLASIVVSHDVRYLAEDTSGTPQGAPATVIRDVDSGAVVGTAGPNAVWAFSGDTSAVLLGLAGAHAVEIADIHGRGGRPVPVDGSILFVVARPDAPDFAVFSQLDGGADGIVIVHRDGSVSHVTGGYTASVLG